MSVIKVGKDDVNLDDDILKFSPETINEFLSQYASMHRYYQNKYSDAAYIVKKYTDSYNALLHTKFKQAKLDHECSDKMAEAYAKSDVEVLATQEKMRMAEYTKEELWGFLRSMDYAHEDAKELCYNLRKELDKIYPKTISRKFEDVLGNE